MTLNKVHLVGRCGRDPEVKYSVNYLNWQDLPSKAHEVLITNLRSLIA
jgi:single-stranded DNA-binding protein